MKKPALLFCNLAILFSSALALAEPSQTTISQPVTAQAANNDSKPALPPTTVELYGLFDTYAGYTNAGGKGSQFTMDSGGYQASRFGVRGYSQVTNNVRITYDLENGFQADSGALSDSTRIFNRQAWFGVAGKFGEFRFGRENSPLFDMLGSMDTFSGATYGSFLNNVALYTPRYDTVFTYRSPVVKGWRVQAHASLGEANTKSAPLNSLNAYIAAAEYTSKNNKFYFGTNYAQQNSANVKFAMRASFTGASYDYGRGKLYFGYFHGNTATSNVSTNVQGPYYDAYAITGNFRVTPKFRVGAGWGWANEEIKKPSNMHEPSVIGMYDFSRWGMVYGTAGRLVNENAAAFALSAAGPITKNVPAPGHNVTGVQLGVRFTFSGKIFKQE